MFDAFFKVFASILAFFYDITNNYALAIILLTLAVMIIVTPLTLKGTRSMMMMQQLQPEMRKIQARYKDDRQKLNEEMLKFYKENSINPVGGCLPLLVQMPVFLVLYQVLRGLTRRVSDLGSAVGWASGQTPPTKAPSIERVFDPAWISSSSKMYQNLSNSFQMKAFGMDLSESASKAFGTGIVHALPFLVLIAIVAATGFIQQRQIQGRNPNAQVNPQQQMIMKIMPVFLPVISFGLPAGLVLYFAVSNLYRIGQQAFISHSIYGVSREEKAAGASGPTWKEMLGFGTKPGGSTKSKARSGPKGTTKAKQKAIPASSRAASRTSSKAADAKAPPKPATKGRAPAKSGAPKSPPAKNGRTTPAKTNAQGRTTPTRTATKPSEPAPAKPARTRFFQADRSPAESGSEAPASPSSAGKDDQGSTPLQPRARKKKR